MGIFAQAAYPPRPAGVPEHWEYDPVLNDWTEGPISVNADRAPVAIESVGAPRVAQPAWQNLPGGDPTPVNPNDPTLLDRRRMVWEAQEAQRQAAAQAMGRQYEPQQQNGDEFHTNPDLQFGTTGVLRDIIGNATDFFGQFIGRKPSYRNEKFRDAIYGWDQPGGFEAAINRGMQYDPEMTQEFLKNITGARAQQANADANSEYKTASSQQRRLQAVSGIAQGIQMAPDPAASYEKGGRAALQQQLDLAHGPGVVTLPEQYDGDIMAPLVRSGYGGNTVQKENQAIMSDETKRFLETNKIASREQIAKWSNETKVRVAGILANSRLGAAEIAAEVRRAIADEDEGVVNTSEDYATGTKMYVPREAIRKGQRGTYRGQSGYMYNGRFYPESN